ncbi:MAG: hypothetical protein WCQ16_00380, partial [Verrucomicrobiae bacterium]
GSGVSTMGDDLKCRLAPVENEIPLALRNSPDDSGKFQPQLLGVDDFGCGIHIQLKITFAGRASSDFGET